MSDKGIACKHPDDPTRLIVKRVDGTHYELPFNSTQAASAWASENYHLIDWNRFDFPFVQRIKRKPAPLFFIRKHVRCLQLVQRTHFNRL